MTSNEVNISDLYVVLQTLHQWALIHIKVLKRQRDIVSGLDPYSPQSAFPLAVAIGEASRHDLSTLTAAVQDGGHVLGLTALTGWN